MAMKDTVIVPDETSARKVKFEYLICTEDRWIKVEEWKND